MAGLRLLVILVCGLFHVSVLGSTSPARLRITPRRKLRDPIARPEFSEYELSEYSQSEPPPRRHYQAVSSESEEDAPSRSGRFTFEEEVRSTSSPITIKGKNKHPLHGWEFESYKFKPTRNNIQTAFKHHHKPSPKKPTNIGDGVRRSASDFWSEYKRRESGVVLPERKVATVRGPTPPRRLRARKPAVTYQVYLTPSDSYSSSSSTSSGDEYRRNPSYSSVSSEEDQSMLRRHSTDIDLIFELSIDQKK